MNRNYILCFLYIYIYIYIYTFNCVIVFCKWCSLCCWVAACRAWAQSLIRCPGTNAVMQFVCLGGDKRISACCCVHCLQRTAWMLQRTFFTAYSMHVTAYIVYSVQHACYSVHCLQRAACMLQRTCYSRIINEHAFNRRTNVFKYNLFSFVILQTIAEYALLSEPLDDDTLSL